VAPEAPIRPRAYFGVGLDGTAEEARVNEISKDSPAEHAGLKMDDIVTEVDGKPIKNALNLADAVRRHKPGDKISLTVKRGEESLTLEVTLSKQ
jgi:S1-C subfamily serine protease